MEITLKATIEVEVWTSVEVDSIDEVRDAFEYFEDHLYMAGHREVGDLLIEYEQTDVNAVTVEDESSAEYGDVEMYIDDINDDPDHPLHETTDDDDELDGHDETADDDALDAINEAELINEDVDTVNASAAPSNIIHIPEPPKKTRRTGIDAFKHAFKKFARRF